MDPGPRAVDPAARRPPRRRAARHAARPRPSMSNSCASGSPRPSSGSSAAASRDRRRSSSSRTPSTSTKPLGTCCCGSRGPSRAVASWSSCSREGDQRGLRARGRRTAEPGHRDRPAGRSPRPRRAPSSRRRPRTIRSSRTIVEELARRSGGNPSVPLPTAANLPQTGSTGGAARLHRVAHRGRDRPPRSDGSDDPAVCRGPWHDLRSDVPVGLRARRCRARSRRLDAARRHAHPRVERGAAIPQHA